MKAIFATIYACLFCIINCASSVQASGQTKPIPHKSVPQRAIIYRLMQIHVADSIPTKYVWVVYDEKGSILPEGEGAVYESLYSPALRQWVSHLPAGSTITVTIGLNLNRSSTSAPSGTTTKDPYAWGGQGLKDFDQFCRGKEICFLIMGVSA